MLTEAQIKNKILTHLKKILKTDSGEEKIKLARELDTFVTKEVVGIYAFWNEKNNKKLKKFKDHKISEIVHWVLNLQIYDSEDTRILDGNIKFWLKKFE